MVFICYYIFLYDFIGNIIQNIVIRTRNRIGIGSESGGRKIGSVGRSETGGRAVGRVSVLLRELRQKTAFFTGRQKKERDICYNVVRFLAPESIFEPCL